MALIHDVIDSDVRFVINPVTRSISNQGSGKLILIKGDHNSERFSFEIPRIVEGHDMSLCNVVRIHYINTCAKTRSTSCDIYEPDDFGVSETDPNLVLFSWLIDGKATVYSGSLAFAIEFQCTVGEKIVYSWHTGLNSTISISDTLNNTEAIVEDYSDILTTWWLRIFANSTLPIEIHSIESFAALNGETKENTLYLLEDDPTLEEIRRIAEERNYDDEIAALKADASTLYTRTKNLYDYVKALQLEDRKTNSDVTTILNSLSSINTTLTSISSELQSLSSRVSTLEANGGGSSTPDSGGTTDPEEPEEPGDSEEPEEPEHNHSYTVVDVVVAATCTARGYTSYKCSCGNSGTVNRDYTDALGHELEDTVVDPTCGEQGYTLHSCTREGCDYSETDMYTPATGYHSWNYYTDDSTGESISCRECTVCGTIETDVDEPSDNACNGNHSWEEYRVQEATCTNNGYKIYMCSVCGETYEEANGEATGHNYIVEDDGNGGTQQRCSVCGDVIPE